MLDPNHPTPVNPWRGRLLVLATALLWSTSGFFVKAPFFAGEEWTGAVLAFWRSLFAGAVILPMVRRVSWSWRMLPMMLCFAAMCYCYITSMSLMSKSAAGCALWLQCTAPTWVFLVGVLLLKEPADYRDWLQTILCTTGVVAMIVFRSSGAPPLAILLGLASGALYAGIILMLRNLRSHDSAWLSVLNQFATAAALAPLAFTDMPTPDTTQWLLLIAFGALQLGLPYFLFSLALKDIPGHEASIVALIEPLLLPLWIYLAWNEAPDAIVFIGGAWILVGMLVKYVLPANEVRSRKSEG